jgi:hypothetical protein
MKKSVCHRPYNSSVPLSSPSRSPHSLWDRFAAFMSFVAVLSALLAPISMLAEEVRTGKLGGLCSANNSVTTSLTSQNAGDVGSGGVSLRGSHCDLCGSLTLAPPPWPAVAMPALPAGDQLASVYRSIVLSAAVPGLPPGRGPPSQL